MKISSLQRCLSERRGRAAGGGGVPPIPPSSADADKLLRGPWTGAVGGADNTPAADTRSRAAAGGGAEAASTPLLSVPGSQTGSCGGVP